MESIVNENYETNDKTKLNEDEVQSPNLDDSIDQHDKGAACDLDNSKTPFIKESKDSKPSDVQFSIKEKDDFTGLTKEELLKYANDPFWTKLRLALFILFWVGWVAMLAAAIIIIVLAPRCPYRPELNWWQKEITYQCYPKSFQDSLTETNQQEKMNVNDGIGDLQGFNTRLGYLLAMNVSTVWMNSIYHADQFGILNHTHIDSQFGTDVELRKILKKMRKKSMKMVFDFVPSYTSQNHTWFQNSRIKTDKYADYYIWRPCKQGSLPSDKLNAYGKKAWTRCPVRKECYYHSGLSSQPDLNVQNDDVRQELKDILRYWLKFGVDGLYISDVTQLPDGNSTSKSSSTVSSLELIQEWREVVDEFSKPGREKLLFTSLPGDVNSTLPYLGTEGKNGVHFVATQVLYNLSPCGAACLRDIVQPVIDATDKTTSFGWRVGDENNNRVASRVPPESLIAFHSLHMLLPGNEILYYGDEIGLRNQEILFKDVRDPVGLDAGKNHYRSVYRDLYRTPMRWDSSLGAGFTKGVPWLPIIHKGQPTVEEHQAALQSKQSLHMFYSKLAGLRQRPSFRWGKTIWSVCNDNLLSFVRTADGFPSFLVTLHFGKTTEVVKFSDSPPDMFPNEMNVVLHSTKDKIGKTIDPHKMAVTIEPGDAIVFEFTRKK